VRRYILIVFIFLYPPLKINKKNKVNPEAMIKPKLLKRRSGLQAEEVAAGYKGSKKKPKLYPIPEEDSFMPIDEDSEEVIYKTKKSAS